MIIKYSYEKLQELTGGIHQKLDNRYVLKIECVCCRKDHLELRSKIKPKQIRLDFRGLLSNDIITEINKEQHLSVLREHVSNEAQ